MKKLSIGIPTYNRKKQLSNQLERLLKQDLTQVEKNFIIDNDSNYNVQSLISHFNSNKLKLIANPFNMGASTNGLNPFLYSKSEWLWILSDDDEVLHNSIEIIIDEINKSGPNLGMIKFSIQKDILPESKVVNSLNDYIDYYHNEKNIRYGELIFISTCVLNTKNLNNYLDSAFVFSYTHVGFLVPVIFGLDEKKISVSFTSETIVKYLPPDDNGWNLGRVGLGLSTFSHLNLSLNKIYFKKFIKIMTPISYIEMFKFLIQENRINNQRKYELVYNNSYKYYLNFFQKIIYGIFKIILSYPRSGKYLFEKIKLYYKRIKHT